MTDYEKFQDLIKNGILVYLPNEYQTALVEIIPMRYKQEEIGLKINKDAKKIFTVVPLESYYRKFQKGVPLQIIFNQIADEFLEAEQIAPQTIEEYLQTFSFIKDRIYLRLANKEISQESLGSCLHKEIEGTDMVAIFYANINTGSQKPVMIPLLNKLIDIWNLDLEFLYELALRNTAQQMPARIFRLDDICFGVENALNPEEMFQEENEIYVLTNASKYMGATTILYPGMLQFLSKGSNSNFYILPSSINEVLLLKDRGNMEAGELKYVVEDMNESFLDTKDILSDQIYYYDGVEQKLSIVTAPEKMIKNFISIEVENVEEWER